MELSGADITRIMQAFCGIPGDPPPPLAKRRARDNSLWYSWAGRTLRLVRAEFETTQEAVRRLIEDRDETIVELRKRRTRDNGEQIDEQIRAAEKKCVAEMRKLNDQTIDIPGVEPFGGLMAGVEMSPEERANLGALLPDVLRGIDDVETSEADAEAA